MGCLSFHTKASKVYGSGSSRIRRIIAQGFKNANRIIYAVDIGLGANIDPSCKFPHQGLGTVIHSDAVVGRDCVICQGVTIGQNGLNKGVPIIEMGVMVGANSTLMGKVTVGEGSIIGANSVVVSDVPAYCVVAGVPAKIIRRITEDK